MPCCPNSLSIYKHTQSLTSHNIHKAWYVLLSFALSFSAVAAVAAIVIELFSGFVFAGVVGILLMLLVKLGVHFMIRGWNGVAEIDFNDNDTFIVAVFVLCVVVAVMASALQRSFVSIFENHQSFLNRDEMLLGQTSK